MADPLLGNCLKFMSVKSWKVKGSGRNKIITIELGFKRKHKSPSKLRRDAARKRSYFLRKHHNDQGVRESNNTEPSTYPSSTDLEPETEMSLDNDLKTMPISPRPTCEQVIQRVSNKLNSYYHSVCQWWRPPCNTT